MPLPKIVSLAADPPRLFRAVARRVKEWHQANLSTHTRAASAARRHGRLVIADMDWYGYSNVDFEKLLAEDPTLDRSFHVQKIPRAATFSWKRDASRIRRVWDEPGSSHVATYGRLKLWEICKASAIKELGYFPREKLTSAERALVDQFFHWAVLCIDGVEKVLDRVQPYAVVVFQGGLFDSRCVVECAARRGIRTIAVETSFVGDHALVDSLSGIVINRHTLAARGSTLYEARVLTEPVDVTEFWQASLVRKSDQHRTGSQSVAELGLPPNKKLVLAIGQVAVDASIVLDSPIYRSPAELIGDVLAVTEAHPDWHLIARLHPKEAWHYDSRNSPYGPGEYLWDNTLVELQRRGLHENPNLTIVSGPGISTYDLMRLCQAGVTINSQAGLEMALMGKPVITTGRCFYAHNGFTWDLARRELLKATLESAMNHSVGELEMRRVHDFCRYLFGHFLVPLGPEGAAQRLARLREVLGIGPQCRE